ncbi:TIGR03751 family conjugal transfer lipoprotein [Nitrogeniibacter aestuarii]|uniref:TIGR03751 family conjugal transfer lipoprotein n=1 Tax=Nitrogeniibacter aestuarii TaxID=2815343 RepID=UPI001E419D85|nr:TIGR03751 family conjugal transfer lipoprotein [Nitrogeniibacter aestuarii]
MACAALLSACTVVGPRSSPLPTDGPEMKEIFDGHSNNIHGQDLGFRHGVEQRPALDDASIAIHEQPSVASVEQRFPRVPNPDLVMWVAPHLSPGRYPVPGYLTVFPMYERVEYLLPGEAEAWRGAN